MSDSYLKNAGSYANYWSRNGKEEALAYYFRLDASTTNPSTGPSGRYHGFSLRCLQE